MNLTFLSLLFLQFLLCPLNFNFYFHSIFTPLYTGGLNFSTDLLDCHVDICSPELMLQFSDNFDYQVKYVCVLEWVGGYMYVYKRVRGGGEGGRDTEESAFV